MLIRRQLNTLKKLVEEYELIVGMVLVPSNKNMANRLMRVPQQWFTAIKMENGPKSLICAIHVDELDADQIMAIHRSSGHPGVQHTTYSVRRICPATPRAAVKITIRTCEECPSTSPLGKGTLEVDDNWQRMDITHYGAHHFLMLTDCGPLRFSIWRQLARQDSASMIRQLETVFFEHGPPHKLFRDNDTAFCSRKFRAFANDWGVNFRFRCAYVPAWNGIAERCHHTVKCIAARMYCLIQESVYWHNVTPRDSMSPPTAPANKIYHYEVKVKEVDALVMSSGPGRSYYQVRNRVRFKTPQNWCTTKFSKGRVTEVISLQSVLVDGIPRHVKDLHPWHSGTSLEEDSDGTPSESKAESLLCDIEDTESDDLPEEGAVAEPPPMPLRKSTWRKQLPPLPHLWSWDRGGV